MKSWRSFNKDRVSGLLLLFLGAGIGLQGMSYQMGELTRLGAGFVPVVLGTLLVLIGAAIFLTAEPNNSRVPSLAPLIASTAFTIKLSNCARFPRPGGYLD